ncbi:DegT/DnrJ/EryC1/StrS family aminotransferase [Bdellovibrio bacteriovorus]|uniref:TDP-4-oxo-6-deoxy-D-glucose transaminase n=1 Tax=Bdellovibrio bacteriovorus str. Tiberius TaxID=1069642 RepID=K7ZFC1_BDEBC|nr:DegT/DnrJ/EryC1/StrS aminotransferase family protein [Bdellovibrio bacteriovorus]AFY01377.1 TDP-4-oxo-6-deoxy-D-glucose transaminase [Bdellovibrio bacteriovorus str. Tiberius]
MKSHLAIDGGAPVRSVAIAPWPFYDQDEVEKTVSILKSGKVNYWTGSETRQFEEEFAHYHGMRHGIALANGTLALELALIGYGIGHGDEVITTCRTFIASASCIVRVGATPILVDVDLKSQNLLVSEIEKVITPRTKAIIAVHLAGWPCDMDAILEVARKHSLKVIEDCAQSHGAKYKGQFAGSFGDMSAFSFCQDKIISTTGEGGMLLLNDTELYEKLWAFKDHGKSFDAVFRRIHPPGFRWLHESFGTNWRMTEIQGAVGRIQLKKLEGWIQKRRKLASEITQGIGKVNGLVVHLPDETTYHSYYKYYVMVESSSLKPGWNRDRIMAAINAEGVPCFSGSCSEIYLEQAFKKAELGPSNRFANAKKLGEDSLMFLVHPTLDSGYVADLMTAVTKVMNVAAE